MDATELAQRVRKLEARVADLKSRLPAHSVPASLLLQLEELEDELAWAKSVLASGGESHD